MVELIERADAVVMDLRGFSAQRLGCEFELCELVARTSPVASSSIVDASTDRVLLAACRRDADRTMEVRRDNARQAGAAFVALLAAAA